MTDAVELPHCRAHPSTPATGTCSRCLRETCDVCTVYVGASPHCPACARTLRDRQRMQSTVLALVALAAVIGGALYGINAFRKRTADAIANPVLTLSPEAQRLDEALQREPCDRAKIVELASHLRRAGENRAVVTRADAFFARCGDLTRLRWIKAEALDTLSQWDAATIEWTRLVDAEPNSATYRFWRGVSYSNRGDLAHAIVDFEQALAISPRINNVPFNLATAYEQAHRPCDAIFPLEQFVYYNPDVRNRMEIEARIRRLYENDACRAMAGSGRAVLRPMRGAGVLRAPVSVNGRPAGQFAVDTGASLVALSAATAARLGIVTTNWETITVQTAGGRHPAKYGWVDRIEVQGVSAQHVQVAIVEDLGDLDGLLGLSFLARFTVSMDRGGGTVEIAARTDAPHAP